MNSLFSSRIATPQVIAFILAFFFAASGFALEEIDPNDTPATANALDLTQPQRVRASIFPNADQDYYSFQASAGSRLYAATMTASSATASTDSVMTIFDTDGVTPLETDLGDGSFGTLSSSIAGFEFPADGIYFLQVKHFSATNQLRPYILYLALTTDAPTSEVEPNNDISSAQSLSTSAFRTGAIAAPADRDFYSVELQAGETIFASLDLDPERDGTTFNGRLTFLHNSAGIQANDANVTSPNSESLFFTVKEAGTYPLIVDDAASGGSSTSTYGLKVEVFPAAEERDCISVEAMLGLPLAIPTGPGQVESALSVSGAPRVGRIEVSLDLAHSFYVDLDVTLRSPDGAEIALFTDIGPSSSAAFSPSFSLSDENALPISSTQNISNGAFRPELNFQTALFHGSDPNGEWRLIVRDDAAGDGGSLNGWSIKICGQESVCADGFIPSVIYQENFENGPSGFTHSGLQDEWELGLPAFGPLSTCHSGVNCWNTDLDNTYNASSDQTLLSAPIDLSSVSGPVVVTWAQKYQMENATFDRYDVFAQEVGNPSSKVSLFTWMGATMTSVVGNPSFALQGSSAWGLFNRDVSDLIGKQIELGFRVQTDTSVQLAGPAIDDITLTACRFDSDGDGTPDEDEDCSADPNKILPGICGCGIADDDSDGDGVADCLDSCPADPDKAAIGTCGCGIADTDTDSDGVADCIDSCPTDVSKIAGGICGCGVMDTDSDNDGAADCLDLCPSNGSLIQPGVCGCVTPLDSNTNGAFDCVVDAELKAQLIALQTNLAKLKLPRNKKQANQQRLLRASFQEALGMLSEFSTSNVGELSLNQDFDLVKTLRNAQRSLKKLSRVRTKTFGKSKRALKKALSKYFQAIAE